MDEARILIIGGGIGGAATAWFLARRGARGVVVLEREHALGLHATAQNAAILRTPMPDALTEEFARESAAFLRDPPPGFSTLPLLAQCGIVLASRRSKAQQSAWEARLEQRAASGEVEELSAARLRELAPHFASDGARAWFLPREGRIDNRALLAGFEVGARADGVSFEFGARVASLIVERGAVRGARLENGRVWRAEQTVIAAGGWAARLGRAAGSRVELRPTRRHLFVSAPDARVDPRWPVVWTDSDAFYARPEAAGLMLCACDEVDVDPDVLRVDPAVRAQALAKAARHLPRNTPLAIEHEWSGVRTLTHDDRFVIGPDGDVPGLAWVAGLGGHGMTCSGAIGRLAADLILDGQSAHPAARAFAPARMRAPGEAHANASDAP